MNISILGAGVWGRAVGKLVADRGHTVSLLHHTARDWNDVAEQILPTPGSECPPPSEACTSPAGPMDFLMLGLPVQHIRETIRRLAPPGVPVLGLSKGLEIRSGKRVSELVTELWGEARVGALSGPTFATEIQRGQPAACVVAAENEALAEAFQDLLHQPSFRTYRSTDLTGVELGGALKNVYAIACGACAGLDLGENCQAALFTRCLAEMTRLGVHSGGRAETFAGLSGVGDLHLTGMSQQSRNHRVGRLLAAGHTLNEALARLGGVAEGVPTTRSAYENELIPADAKPIVTEVYRILYEGKNLADAVRDLLGRSMKKEVY
ncbi:NAD(P)-dependent glycerol-3-phosphate dehydrogenase [Verrucomicrobia bacterium LW23]|nr:NAD(P)-dependent glycerol-3-phosphate dehydrogenase [Verrucomicrobia bacterium LW23]